MGKNSLYASSFMLALAVVSLLTLAIALTSAGSHRAFANPSVTASALQHASNDSYPIIYQLNGGTQRSRQIYFIEKGKTLAASKLKQPKRAGYLFMGWYSDKKLTKRAMTVIGAAAKSKRMVYAKWKIVTYRIKYKPRGGSLPSGTKLTYAMKTGKAKFATPTRKGYAFLGWYADKNFETKVASIPKWSKGTIILYAKWQKLRYGITYNANGGMLKSASPASYTITTKTTSLPVPIKVGYSFMGWKTPSAPDTIWEVAKGSTGNMSLTARWRKRLYIAHRGYRETAVSNSLMAFKEAKDQGFDGVEADIRFTLDGVPIVRHDSEITIVAKRNDGDGTVNVKLPIALLSYKKLQAVLFNSDVSGEDGNNVTTLDDLIRLCKETGMYAVLHLKEGTQNQVKSTVAAVESQNMSGNVRWSSSSVAILKMVKNADPDASLLFGLSSAGPLELRTATTLKAGGSDVMGSLKASEITPAKIRACKENAIPISVYGLDNEEQAAKLNQFVSMYLLDGLKAKLS